MTQTRARKDTQLTDLITQVKRHNLTEEQAPKKETREVYFFFKRGLFAYVV